MIEEDKFEVAKKFIQHGEKIITEIEKNTDLLNQNEHRDEKKILKNHISALEKTLKELNLRLSKSLVDLTFSKPLEIEKKLAKNSDKPKIPKEKKDEEEERDDLSSKGGEIYNLKQVSPRGLEKQTIRRLRESEENLKKEKPKSKSNYSKIASQFFSKYSWEFIGKKSFEKMEDDLMKANLNFTPKGYLSVIMLTTFLSFFAAGFFFLFFLFFNFGAAIPMITRITEPISERFFKVVWILLLVPLSTFLMMYIYPSLERKSAGESIDRELPFATIHMAAISSSMINPVNIFRIISSTKEYPALDKEFTKMINEINIYGYDLVSALKNTAKNSSSKKLSELLNGLSTTISSGGDLPKFFEKRAETLLFDYRINQEKDSRKAETLMDMYISLILAGPMILMLLMMIMKISGLGIGMSIGMIAFMIIVGVTFVNILFLIFLNMRKTV